MGESIQTAGLFKGLTDQQTNTSPGA